MKFKLYTEIAFNQDLKEYSVRRGDIGTLVEFHDPNDIISEPGYSVEIFDAYGDTLKVITVPESKITEIKHNSVLSVRELEYA